VKTHGVAAALRRPVPPFWFWLAFGATYLANRIASFSAEASIELMAHVSDFAEAVRAHNLTYLPVWQMCAYPAIIALLYVYTRPVLAWFADGCPPGPSLLVQRRAVSAPLVYAAAGFLGWLVSIPAFIGLTIGAFGRWAPELASQHVLTPVINGFLAATIAYFLVDRVYRHWVYPRVFPEGGLADVPGAFALGVRGRFLVLLLSLSFVPMFVMLGLARAAEARLGRGLEAATLLGELTAASQLTFGVYVLVGGVLAVLVTRSFTSSLDAAAEALRRVRRGDLDVRVRAGSADEVGMLEDGVNQMVAALRDRERILQTFGRVVDPGIRDRLLGGSAQQGGELRHATVLFCDLRGFTAMSESGGAKEAVATLNEFFTVTTAWVRECGGFVDKFIGDAALVVFGLLDDDGTVESAQRSAAAAVRCALGLEERLRPLNERRRSEGREPLAVTNAIHSGEVVAGVIGASERHEYTVVGDTVNVAARLQQAAKEHSGIVISEGTCELARAAGFHPPVFRTDSVVLRGRREPVVVHVLPRGDG
jgi:adenylate cyclase